MSEEPNISRHLIPTLRYTIAGDFDRKEIGPLLDRLAGMERERQRQRLTQAEFAAAVREACVRPEIGQRLITDFKLIAATENGRQRENESRWREEDRRRLGWHI